MRLNSLSLQKKFSIRCRHLGLDAGDGGLLVMAFRGLLHIHQWADLGHGVTKNRGSLACFPNILEQNALRRNRLSAFCIPVKAGFLFALVVPLKRILL